MKISPDVIRDLIPLVKDGVASKDTVNLVHAYMQENESIRAEFEDDVDMNISFQSAKDDKVIAAIKRSIVITRLLVLIIGAAIGIAMTNSFGILYNLLIMPFIGALSVISFKGFGKWLTPVVVFVAAFVWQVIHITAQGGILRHAFNDAIFYSTVYAILVALGVVIAILLKFAFRKETT